MASRVEDIVESFIEAFNARDVERLMEFVDEDVDVSFSGRAPVRGREELRDFLERQTFGAAYRVRHERRFASGDELVAESIQELRYVENDELAGVERLAALYAVSDGSVRRYAEFTDLASAFAASGVGESDEIG